VSSAAHGRDTLETMRTAYIGMGGNLASWAGMPEATLAAAALRLESLGGVVRRSSLYSTEPMGFAEQPRFVNAVVALEMELELEPQELLRGLLAIEQEFGRDRAAGFVNGPRTLDLDILLFGDLEISEPDLDIPHPRLAERAFVLIPLNEIAAELVVPGRGETVAQLAVSQVSKSRPPSASSGQAFGKLRAGSGAPSSDGEPDAVVRVHSEIWDTR
jgi:2-amino-4-hydroxy-6-hydroxymethyldihydropteridine diphosphokinase